MNVFHSQLINSVECLAREETIFRKNKYPYIYIPVIITTAKIELCHFNTSKINLSDGLLQDGTFSTVPFVRFRKSLTTELTPLATPMNLKEANEDKERTILVINSEKFCSFLSKIEIKKFDQFDGWPWDSYLKQIQTI